MGPMNSDAPSGPAAGRDGPTAIEFFWRPGCPFCSMLERGLINAGIPIVKRNIWDEPAAADIVRSVADDNQTVPTVRVDGRALVNPSVAEVRELVAALAPELLPGG